MNEITKADITKLQSALLNELGKVEAKNQHLEQRLKSLEEGVNIFRMNLENKFNKEVKKMQDEVKKALEVNQTTLGKVSFLEKTFEEVEGDMQDQITHVENMLEPFTKTLKKPKRGLKT